MTCREKLKNKLPHLVDDNYIGGCCFCPDTYNYLMRPDFCTDGLKRSDDVCAKCWDREIPEEKSDMRKAWEKIQENVEKEPLYKYSGEPIAKVEGVREENGGITATLKPKTFSTKKEIEEILFGTPVILDSGNRREFGTGAVRDIQEGKGRMDLMPLDVIAEYIKLRKSDRDHPVLTHIFNFINENDIDRLYAALSYFANEHYDCEDYTMLLEVSKHFEEGAKKYGENNWQKGIPTHCYIDSAVRHYLKFLRGDKDEPHDRAFVWNILCCIWTCKHKPELNDYGVKDVETPVKEEEK